MGSCKKQLDMYNYIVIIHYSSYIFVYINICIKVNNESKDLPLFLKLDKSWLGKGNIFLIQIFLFPAHKSWLDFTKRSADALSTIYCYVKEKAL